MDNLPYELQFGIASKLSPINIVKLCESSSELSTLCTDEKLWKDLFMRYYGRYMYDDAISKLTKNTTWYKAFRECYRSELHSKLPSIYLYINKNFLSETSNKYGEIYDDYYKLMYNVYEDNGTLRQTMNYRINSKLVDMIDETKGPANLKIIPLELIKEWVTKDIREGKWNMVLSNNLDYDYISEVIAVHQKERYEQDPFTSCSTHDIDFILSFYSYRPEILKSVNSTIAKYESECMKKGKYTVYDNFTVIKGGKIGVPNPVTIDYNIRDILKRVELKPLDNKYKKRFRCLYIYQIGVNSYPTQVIMKYDEYDKSKVRAEYSSEGVNRRQASDLLKVLYNFNGDIVIATRRNFSQPYFKYVMDNMKKILNKIPRYEGAIESFYDSLDKTDYDIIGDLEYY